MIDTLRFVVSNTTEEGIVFDAEDRFELNPQNIPRQADEVFISQI